MIETKEAEGALSTASTSSPPIMSGNPDLEAFRARVARDQAEASRDGSPRIALKGGDSEAAATTEVGAAIKLPDRQLTNDELKKLITTTRDGRRRSVTDAAKTMGVSYKTVYNVINALEERGGVETGSAALVALGLEREHQIPGLALQVFDRIKSTRAPAQNAPRLAFKGGTAQGAETTTINSVGIVNFPDRTLTGKDFDEIFSVGGKFRKLEVARDAGVSSKTYYNLRNQLEETGKIEGKSVALLALELERKAEEPGTAIKFMDHVTGPRAEKAAVRDL